LRPAHQNTSYAYRVAFIDEMGHEAVFTGLFDGSSSTNRFHGVQFTTEDSPDTQGIIDGPDDGDWRPFTVSPGSISCHPNPTAGIIFLTFDNPFKNDSVYFSINVTPNGYLKKYPVHKYLSGGTISTGLDLSLLPPGEVRLYLHLYHDGQEYISRGDIMIKK
jgi:hypothetical protein